MRKWNRVVRSYLKKVKSAKCALRIKMIDVIHTKPPNQCKHRKKKKNDDDTLDVYKEKYECSKITPTKN